MENGSKTLEWVKITSISGSTHITQKQFVMFVEGFKCAAAPGECKIPVHYTFMIGPLHLEVRYEEAVRVWKELGIPFEVPTFEDSYKGLIS